ncbi:MAG: RNA pseudouridine synthase [Lachnospiraceae bacterium]
MKPAYLQAFHEDEHIFVCCKLPQIATQSSKIGSPDMVSLIKNYLYTSHNLSREPYLAVIHRLDQPVSGILVFAKTPFAAKELNNQLKNHGFGKYYRALIDKVPEKSEGVLENYLVKNSKTNTSRICSPQTPGAKFARLSYKTVKKGQGIFNLGRSIFNFTPSPTELDIELDTGRHHQIRVQLAAHGWPIIGDTKYNPAFSRTKQWQNICLCAYKLEFCHPKTGELMHFEIPEIGTGLNESGTGYF